MLIIDCIVGHTARKLTKSYSDELQYFPNTNELAIVRYMQETVKTRKIPFVSPDDVPGAINRLVDSGHFRISMKYNGGYFFCITPRMRHRFAFFLDSFTKDFFGGFISGVAATLGAALITYLLGLWQIMPK